MEVKQATQALGCRPSSTRQLTEARAPTAGSLALLSDPAEARRGKGDYCVVADNDE